MFCIQSRRRSFLPAATRFSLSTQRRSTVIKKVSSSLKLLSVRFNQFSPLLSPTVRALYTAFEDEQQCELRMGKIHFVDLAGSERMENELFTKQKAVKGKTVIPGRSGPPITKELIDMEIHDINKSLQSLTHVITSLVKNATIAKVRNCADFKNNA